MDLVQYLRSQEQDFLNFSYGGDGEFIGVDWYAVADAVKRFQEEGG